MTCSISVLAKDGIGILYIIWELGIFQKTTPTNNSWNSLRWLQYISVVKTSWYKTLTMWLEICLLHHEHRVFLVLFDWQPSLRNQHSVPGERTQLYMHTLCSTVPRQWANIEHMNFKRRVSRRAPGNIAVLILLYILQQLRLQVYFRRLQPMSK